MHRKISEVNKKLLFSFQMEIFHAEAFSELYQTSKMMLSYEII